ncbi:hypothetical protein QWI17_03730 [Gilvimarinus sp. SDUM040013]|uniref:Glycosyltransferase RgtA/B/C/D-like domain-containing protein n=1 Tax=Gilvimarinus gilvus TaxID=3058038 RepID=A0ABU4S3X7_9GAMM|nr:hypothetical protein [Gilvimarinus sp. SDUM040013]MDO3384948.1 hypothetical protein [Gilvimarinus sp. SDUM040013]MDX6851256.1 hypothetical protein [Gilvimarinus sp. SDUM040013]
MDHTGINEGHGFDAARRWQYSAGHITASATHPMPNSLLKSDRLLATVTVVIGILAIAMAGFDLYENGPFGKLITRAAVLEGGLEAIALASILAVCALLANRIALCIGICVTLAYLRRHNAELCLLAGVLYLEFILGFSRTLRTRLSASPCAEQSLIPDFITGISLWLLLSLLLSWLGFAYPITLLLTLAVLGTACFWVNQQAPITYQFARFSLTLPKHERALIGLLASWFLILAARTANVVTHDSLWYLAQGDRLLAPQGSIFDQLGLVSAVHYFPKLWETLLLPLTYFDDVRVQQGLALAILGWLGLTIYGLCQQLNIKRIWCWYALLVLLSLPAIANSSIALKTDLLCAAFVMMMCTGLAQWSTKRRVGDLFIAIGAGALACSTKLIAIPYVGIVFICALVYEILFTRKSYPAITPPNISQWLMVTSALLVSLGLLLRTWLLTGVPTIGPDPLIAIWQALGMEIQSPAGTWNWTRSQQWSDVPTLLYQWLLAPSNMPSIRITWFGNIWFVCLLLTALAMLIGHKRTQPTQAINRFLQPLAIAGLVIAVAWQYFSRGGDGNYFVIPIVAVTCLAMAALTLRMKAQCSASTVALQIIFLSAFALHVSLSFMNAAWTPPGTRTLDTNFTQKPWQPGNWRTQRLDKAGLTKINQYLETRPNTERLVSRYLKQTAVLLPVRTEAFFSIWVMRPEITATTQNFVSYMQRYQIDHMLFKKPAKEDDTQRQELLEALRKQGWNKIEDRGGVLLTRPDARLNR